MINNLCYEFTFDKEDCFLLFKRLASVYGEGFELDALCSVEKCGSVETIIASNILPSIIEQTTIQIC